VLNSLKDTKQIAEKIGKLFRKYGIKSITMDDIAHELGISKKTLYNIVRDKAELVEVVILQGFNIFKSRILQVMDEKSDAVLQLIKLNNKVTEHLKDFSTSIEFDLRKYYSELHDKLKTSYLDFMKDCISRNIELGKTTGLYRSEIDASIITKLHVARIEFAPHTEVFTLEEYTSPGFAREVCLAQLKSLVSEKGQEFLEKYKNEIIENNK
jgi:AcrR family transcriptional regulator